MECMPTGAFFTAIGRPCCMRSDLPHGTGMDVVCTRSGRRYSRPRKVLKWCRVLRTCQLIGVSREHTPPFRLRQDFCGQVGHPSQEGSAILMPTAARLELL